MWWKLNQKLFVVVIVINIPIIGSLNGLQINNLRALNSICASHVYQTLHISKCYQRSKIFQD